MSSGVTAADAKVHRKKIHHELRVRPGAAANIAGRPTAWADPHDFGVATREDIDQRAREVLAEGIERLSDAQSLLWASDRYAVLVVFQAMDAAGKDSTIKHVMSGINPQGVSVVSFKQPSTEELNHTFLWRVAKAVPERGRIGIFNRSHYEEVVALRVHPDWLEQQRLPAGRRDEAFWHGRFDDINAFERHLSRNGVRVVKFFLNVSKAEQKRRFLARLDKSRKQWKFSASDIAERAFWDDYQTAYEQAITATSTEWAPWFVLPADQKHVMQAMSASILVDTIESLDLQWPKVSDEARRRDAEARAVLEAEPD
jgi:PPK2 family polyphosphate:nucleotide phosphotransferase